MSGVMKEYAEYPREWYHDGAQFIHRCHKPNKREMMKISQAVAVGFLVMGFIGFFVKLVHIPINNVLVGAA